MVLGGHGRRKSLAAKAADDAVFADAVEELHKQIEAHSMELAALFDEWDHDDNGFVDEEEFVVGLRAFGYCTDANTARIVFRRMDMDGSGRIDFREMKKHCHSALHHKASLMAIGSSAISVLVEAKGDASDGDGVRRPPSFLVTLLLLPFVAFGSFQRTPLPAPADPCTRDVLLKMRLVAVIALATDIDVDRNLTTDPTKRSQGIAHGPCPAARTPPTLLLRGANATPTAPLPMLPHTDLLACYVWRACRPSQSPRSPSSAPCSASS